MGNAESGDMASNGQDNEDTNWFNNDADTSFSMSTKGSRRDLRRDASHHKSSANLPLKPILSNKYATNYRSISVDRAMTPVSMVSPVMKNSNSHQNHHSYSRQQHHPRSYSVGKTTPVSMVSPFMTNTIAVQKQPPPQTIRRHTSHKYATPLSTFVNSPVIKSHSAMPAPQLHANMNARHYIPPGILVKRQYTQPQHLPQAVVVPAAVHVAPKRSNSIAKPMSYEAQVAAMQQQQQAKRSYSTPRQILRNQSQIVYSNYPTHLEPRYISMGNKFKAPLSPPKKTSPFKRGSNYMF